MKFHNSHLRFFLKPLTFAVGMALTTSVWAGVDKWTATGPYDAPLTDSWLDNDVIMHPNDPNIWFMLAFGTPGLSNNTIYYSSNAGKSWNIAQDNATWPEDLDRKLVAISIAPSDPKVLYILKGEFQGESSNLEINKGSGDVLKSIDGGVSWTQQTTDKNYEWLVVSPQNPEQLYVYSDKEKSLLKSTDGGANWKTVGPDLTNEDFEAIGIDSENPSSIYVTTETTIHRSQDNGSTWETVESTAEMGVD